MNATERRSGLANTVSRSEQPVPPAPVQSAWRCPGSPASPGPRRGRRRPVSSTRPDQVRLDAGPGGPPTAGSASATSTGTAAELPAPLDLDAEHVRVAGHDRRRPRRARVHAHTRRRSSVRRSGPPAGSPTACGRARPSAPMPGLRGRCVMPNQVAGSSLGTVRTRRPSAASSRAVQRCAPAAPTARAPRRSPTRARSSAVEQTRESVRPSPPRSGRPGTRPSACRHAGGEGEPRTPTGRGWSSATATGGTATGQRPAHDQPSALRRTYAPAPVPEDAVRDDPIVGVRRGARNAPSPTCRRADPARRRMPPERPSRDGPDGRAAGCRSAQRAAARRVAACSLSQLLIVASRSSR